MNKKLFLIVLILGIRVSGQCNSVNLPYTEDFESVTIPALPSCTTIENVGPNFKWFTYNNTENTSKLLAYMHSVSNPANSWFFTPGLNLTGGVEYRITYKYSDLGSTGKLKVAYGMSAHSSSMNNQLADYSNIADDVIHTENIIFTPLTTGIYYLGFNCYDTADEFYYIEVDDISVTLSQLGIQEVNGKRDVKVYPNPFVDTIHVDKAENVQSISISDASGRIMKTISQPSSQIDVKDFIPGLYFINIKMKDGSQNVIKAVKK